MASLFSVIRLKRGGHKHYPFFQLVLTLKYKRNKSDHFTKLGYFNVNFKEHVLFIDLFALGSSLNDGAFLNRSVKKYLSKFLCN